MEVQIELNDRLYYDIVDKAKIEGVEINRYIAQLVEDKFYIDKYGDLNDLIGVVQTKQTEVHKTPVEKIPKEEVKEEKHPNELKVPKKRGRKPKAVKEAEAINAEIQKKEEIVLKTEEPPQAEEPKITSDEVLKKVVKRTRVLKSK